MGKFESFSQSTGLRINPAKCKVYFGSVPDDIQGEIRLLSGFDTGILPFRYLGVPLSSKKLTIAQCQPLIDKIVARIRHWSARLLSYGGRLQLIKSVLFAVTNYWLQCFPLPQGVLHKIEAVCRSFLWSNSDTVTRKAPVAWEQVCAPTSQGGLQVIDLPLWSKACLLKLLWNLCNKEDSLWVKWIHAYYMTREQVMSQPVPPSSSWIMKGIMLCMTLTIGNSTWDSMRGLPKFKTGVMYMALQIERPEVEWKTLMYGNLARPRAKMIMWMACHDRLPTRARLHRFGLLDSATCCFCPDMETREHLLFYCGETKRIWKGVLQWIGVQHDPGSWTNEIGWVLRQSKGKHWRKRLLKLAFIETIYEVWKHRNNTCFGNDRIVHVEQQIITVVIYRAWMVPRLRPHVGSLMVV